MQGEDSNHVVRFGLFEVDLSAGELRRQGLKVKLQEQPFQVLTMLLERPGQVVTREELRERIWPDGIFVDYDKSLSKAVNRSGKRLGTRLKILGSWRHWRDGVIDSSFRLSLSTQRGSQHSPSQALPLSRSRVRCHRAATERSSGVPRPRWA